MKKGLLTGGCLALAAMANAQLATGPSSSQTPFLTNSLPDVKITSILSVGDVVNGYRMVGLPDGSGAFDNGDGTFTFVLNHEIGDAAGVVRAHGSKGAFVSKWIINKSDLRVISGGDLTQRVHLWDVATSSYVAYSVANPMTKGMGRFCSGDLAAPTAYYNAATGKGTQARIMMNGEETGSEGRAFAHVVSGATAGNTYELPYLGKFSWENSVANPRPSDTTIVMGMDDASPTGQVYLYVGTKKNTGLDIEKAGLTGGKLHGIAITGLAMETTAGIPAPGTAFTCIDMGTVYNATGATLNTNSNNLGVTGFLRPEDGAWDPQNPSDFYILTTNTVTASGGKSRLWRLRFNDISNPAAGGTATVLLEGTEGAEMMDNMTIDNWGHILIQEDVGNNARLGRTWQYTIATDALVEIASHDATRFVTGGANFLTQDEEASGIIDAQEILGPGMFIGVDQAHTTNGVTSISGEVVENGQIFALFNPDSYKANPEVSISGNNNAINKGDNTPSTGDNTDFGNIPVNTTTTKTFSIQNAGPGKLTVKGINIGGANAGEFTLVTPPTFPLTIDSGKAQTITVQFAPTAVGLRTATVNVSNNDFNEGSYDFAVQGVALNAVGINAVDGSSFVKLYPNPTGDATTVSLTLKKEEKVIINLIDLNGKAVVPAIVNQFRTGEQNVVLNTSTVPSGIYFVQIEAGSVVTRTRLVVAH